MIPRNYSKISQWIERSSLNKFNDISFNYDVYGDINSIVVCPRKESIVGPEKIGSQKGLVTKGNEYLLPSGLDYSWRLPYTFWCRNGWCTTYRDTT